MSSYARLALGASFPWHGPSSERIDEVPSAAGIFLVFGTGLLAPKTERVAEVRRRALRGFTVGLSLPAPTSAELEDGSALLTPSSTRARQSAPRILLSKRVGM